MNTITTTLTHKFAEGDVVENTDDTRRFKIEKVHVCDGRVMYDMTGVSYGGLFRNNEADDIDARYELAWEPKFEIGDIIQRTFPDGDTGPLFIVLDIDYAARKYKASADFDFDTLEADGWTNWWAAQSDIELKDLVLPAAEVQKLRDLPFRVGDRIACEGSTLSHEVLEFGASELFGGARVRLQAMNRDGSTTPANWFYVGTLDGYTVVPEPEPYVVRYWVDIASPSIGGHAQDRLDLLAAIEEAVEASPLTHANRRKADYDTIEQARKA